MARISDFKAQLGGGGARANQFRVELSFPSYVGVSASVGTSSQFLCKAATLPGSTIDNMPINYRGRVVNIAGERTFAPWQVTVYNDTDFGIRNALEKWADGVQSLTDTTGLTSPGAYQVDLLVHQLDRNGATLKTYKFVDAYPTEIGPIALDFDTINQIETFDVGFTYNYWTTTESTGYINVNVEIG